MTIRLSKLEHLRPFRIQFWTLQTMPWEFDKCCQVGLSCFLPLTKMIMILDLNMTKYDPPLSPTLISIFVQGVVTS